MASFGNGGMPAFRGEGAHPVSSSRTASRPQQCHCTPDISAPITAAQCEPRHNPFGARDERTRHAVAFELAGEIARHEVVVLRAHEVSALLLHVTGVVESGGSELDSRLPSAGQIGGRVFRHLRFPMGALCSEDFVVSVVNDSYLTELHPAGSDRNAGLISTTVSSPTIAAERDARLNGHQEAEHLLLADPHRAAMGASYLQQ